MAYNINLYSDRYRARREWLTLSSAALAAAFLVVVLVAGGGLSRWQAGQARAALQGLDQEAVNLRANLARLAATAPGTSAGDELAVARQQLDSRREVLALLRTGVGTAGEAGFAGYLRGLARQTVDGVWLTGFSTTQGGGEMVIRGRMSMPDRLPRYLQRLGAEPPFRGREFATLSVDRPDRPDVAGKPVAVPYANFVLSSVASAATGDKSAGGRP